MEKKYHISCSKSSSSSSFKSSNKESLSYSSSSILYLVYCVNYAIVKLLNSNLLLYINSIRSTSKYSSSQVNYFFLETRLITFKLFNILNMFFTNFYGSHTLSNYKIKS